MIDVEMNSIFPEFDDHPITDQLRGGMKLISSEQLQQLDETRLRELLQEAVIHHSTALISSGGLHQLDVTQLQELLQSPGILHSLGRFYLSLVQVVGTNEPRARRAPPRAATSPTKCYRPPSSPPPSDDEAMADVSMSSEDSGHSVMLDKLVQSKKDEDTAAEQLVADLYKGVFYLFTYG